MRVPPISKVALHFLRRIVRGYFKRHFRAVRITCDSDLTGLGDRRLVIYANHSSWWDPMLLVLLAEKLLPARRHFAPMDARSLDRYSILKHIGIFGVEMNSARGAAQFLRTGRAIVEGGHVLWVTPQGRFADPRRRPLTFKPGLAALASTIENGCTLQPLAIEYVYWDERLPETLIHFGPPVTLLDQSSEELSIQLETALVSAMETLKQHAMSRDPSCFELIADGRVGTGGFYELGQRVIARLRGRRFQPEHTASTEPQSGRG